MASVMDVVRMTHSRELLSGHSRLLWHGAVFIGIRRDMALSADTQLQKLTVTAVCTAHVSNSHMCSSAVKIIALLSR